MKTKTPLFPATTEKPRCPGWYFVRHHKDYPEWRCIEFRMNDEGHIEPMTGALSTLGWHEFSGPYSGPDTIVPDGPPSFTESPAPKTEPRTEKHL